MTPDESIYTMAREQREALKAQLRSYTTQWAVFGFAALIPVLAIASVASSNVLCATAILGCLTLFALAIAARKWRQVNADLSENRMEFISGRVSLSIHYGVKRQRSYHLQVKNEKFEVSYGLFSSLRNNQIYQIAYAPHSRFVLDATPL